MTMPILLDTDILSASLKSDARVVERTRQHRLAGCTIAISVITRYEIVRGLKRMSALTQLGRFEKWCEDKVVLDVTAAIADHAASIHARLADLGQPIGDADVLIAATALELGYALSTNNEAHFSRVPNLVIDNWLK